MTSLVAYRNSVVTPDTGEALRLLEKAGAEQGSVRIRYKGVTSEQASWQGVYQDPGPTGLPSELSMRPSGREVYLSAEITGRKASSLEELSVLWSLVVPLGFLPWSRFPVPGVHENVFHYLGPWATVIDAMHSEGRGEYAWPSVCAAAQCEVDRWAGPMVVERKIQMHLHRLGVQCGPLDGRIGDRTLAALRAMGLGNLPLTVCLDSIAKLEPPKRAARGDKSEPAIGYFTMRGGPVEAFSSGEVKSTKTRTGYSVSVGGPGRLILLFGEP